MKLDRDTIAIGLYKRFYNELSAIQKEIVNTKIFHKNRK